MAQNAGSRSKGLEIFPSPGVVEWMLKPRPQPDECLKVKKRIKHVFGRIEDIGRFAGADYIDQIGLGLDPPLLEVKIKWKNLAFRIFGISIGSRLYLSEVVLKKRQAYSSEQYRALHARAKSFAEGRRQEQASGNTP